MEQLNASPVSIVILDACHNNPFERSFRKMGGGLAQMDAPKGSFIAYATAPGKAAADGDGKNGLFTQELLKQINVSGLTLETVFKRVRSNVAAKSSDAQMPWDSSSMTGEFFFKPAQVASIEPVPVPPSVHVKSKDEIEQDSWDSVRDSKDIDAVKEYMKQYPKGRFVRQAKVLIATLKAQKNIPDEITIASTRKERVSPKFSIGECIIPLPSNSPEKVIKIVSADTKGYKVFTHYLSDGRLIQAEDYQSVKLSNIDEGFTKVACPKIDDSFSPDKYLSETVPSEVRRTKDVFLQCNGKVTILRGNGKPQIEDKQEISVHIMSGKISFSGNGFLLGKNIQICTPSTDEPYFDSDSCGSKANNERRQYGTYNKVTGALDLSNTFPVVKDNDVYDITGSFKCQKVEPLLN